jgi:Protein of unknown function (DUF2939)
MKRLFALGLLLLAGFYVAWPAWSGYQIHQAIQAKNAGLLESKVDFPSVRTSLRPVLAAKISEGMEKFQSQAGGLGAILGQLKGEMVPKIVETTLASVVNSETIMRVATEGGSFKEALDKIMREQMGRSGMPDAGGRSAGGLGGLGGLGDLIGGAIRQKQGNPVRDVTTEEPARPAPAPTGDQQKAARKFSLSNIKSFRIRGPLSFSVGVAKDPAAIEPDVTADMSFTGFDWKVTGLVPKM